MSLAARSRHVDLLLELDDIAGADIAIETLERLAREARDPRAAAFARLHRARRAALEGRIDEARRALEGVAVDAADMIGSTIPITVASQGVVLAWVQHGPREIGDVVRAYAAGAPAMQVWRAGLAAALADGGRREEALLELDRLAADDVAGLPRDALWLAAMALLTEAVNALELPELALVLHAKLAPFAGRNAVLPTVAYLGPVELWLGILASVGGRGVQALEHFGAARTRAMRDGARTAVARLAIEEAFVLLRDGGDAARARAQELLAGAADDAEAMDLDRHAQRVKALQAQLVPTLPGPVAPGAAGVAGAASLCRIGDVWTITSHGRSIHLNDGRGVRLLALLLERPGTEVHSLDLVAAVDGVAVRQAPIEHSGGQETAGSFGVQGGAGPALDAKAKAEYRLRMATLETELAAAEARRDEPAAAAARTELEFVRNELSTAVGIGGRDRETGSHAERARINVTRAIRSTLKRIAGYDPRIGAELEAGVKTGTFCVYQPDPLRPLVWTVERG
jgi:hypothetical protein